jgi:hypothetical protein
VVVVTDDAKTYQADYYQRNRQRFQEKYEAERDARLVYASKQRKVYRARLKRQVFAAYGNRCNCCGEDNLGFISIDHVAGGGKAHWRAVGGGVAVLLDIIKRGFPADFQLLCFNCNIGRQWNDGICPHKGFELLATTAESISGERHLAAQSCCSGRACSHRARPGRRTLSRAFA